MSLDKPRSPVRSPLLFPRLLLRPLRPRRPRTRRRSREWDFSPATSVCVPPANNPPLCMLLTFSTGDYLLNILLD